MANWFVSAQRPKLRWSIWTTLVLVCCSIVLVFGYSQSTHLQKIQQRGSLNVITSSSPSIYSPEKNRISGFDYELLQAYSQELGVNLNIQVTEAVKQRQMALKLNTADLATFGFINFLAIDQQVSDPILHVNQQIIYNSDNKQQNIAQIADLSKQSVVVIKGSPQHTLLKLWQNDIKDINIVALEATTQQLLNLIKQQTYNYTLISSNDFAINEVFYPTLEVAFDATQELPIQWLISPHKENSLVDSINDFLMRYQQDGRLAQLKERYYGHLNQGIYYVNPISFAKLIKSRLQQYLPLFKAAATKHQIDWRLLAAVSYQESHWRANAVSPTGVRGLMMLTKATAREMGYQDRTKPANSINGGAKYLAQMKKRIPPSIQDPDRSWFALAAYNVGFGHLQDARKLTEKGNKDPNRWLDVKQFLPKLEEKQWYEQTKYGYARGKEPVTYVQNIRQYYDLLKWHFPDSPTISNQLSTPLINIELPSGL